MIQSLCLAFFFFSFLITSKLHSRNWPPNRKSRKTLVLKIRVTFKTLKSILLFNGDYKHEIEFCSDSMNFCQYSSRKISFKHMNNKIWQKTFTFIILNDMEATKILLVGHLWPWLKILNIYDILLKNPNDKLRFNFSSLGFNLELAK